MRFSTSRGATALFRLTENRKFPGLIPSAYFRLFDTIAAQECGTTMTERGKIHSGSIVLDEPIDLPEGTEVVVHVEPVVHEHAKPLSHLIWPGES